MLCLSASLVVTAVAAAKTRPPTGNGIEAVGIGRVAGRGGATREEHRARTRSRTTTPRSGATSIPTYQKAVPQSRWQACQKSHPAAPRNITITRVAVAQANELPVDLSLLGHQNVQEIQVYVQYKTPALAGSQVAVLYTFWLEQGGKWQAVWLSDEYQAYKSGSCYLTPQGPPLY